MRATISMQPLCVSLALKVGKSNNEIIYTHNLQNVTGVSPELINAFSSLSLSTCNIYKRNLFRHKGSILNRKCSYSGFGKVFH